MLESVGVPAELHDQALVALDKLDKIGRDGVRRELSTRGIAAGAIDRLLAAYAPRGGGGRPRRAVGQRESARTRRARTLPAMRTEKRPSRTWREIVRLAAATSAGRIT